MWKRRYPQPEFSLRGWVECIARTLERHAESQSGKKRKELESLAKRIKDCRWDALRAQKNGEARKFSCKTEACPFCRRYASHKAFKSYLHSVLNAKKRLRGILQNHTQELQETLSRVRENLHMFEVGSHLYRRQRECIKRLTRVVKDLEALPVARWYHLVVSEKGEGNFCVDASPEALRKRINACVRTAKDLFEGLFPRELRCCIAWLWRVEISESGVAHVHILYRGPRVSAERATEVAAPVFGAVTDIKVKRVKRKLKNLKKVVRYITKPDGVDAEDWDLLKAGERTKVNHPQLYAAWALACRGVSRIRGCAGLLHGGTGA